MPKQNTPQVTMEFVEAAAKRFCQKLEDDGNVVNCDNIELFHLTYDVNLLFRAGFSGTLDEALEELDNNVGLDRFGILIED